MELAFLLVTLIYSLCIGFHLYVYPSFFQFTFLFCFTFLKKRNVFFCFDFASASLGNKTTHVLVKIVTCIWINPCNCFATDWNVYILWSGTNMVWKYISCSHHYLIGDLKPFQPTTMCMGDLKNNRVCVFMNPNFLVPSPYISAWYFWPISCVYVPNSIIL